MVLQAPFQAVLDGVAEFGHRLEPAHLVQEFGGHLGQFQLLDFQHLEDRRDGLAAQRLVAGRPR